MSSLVLKADIQWKTFKESYSIKKMFIMVGSTNCSYCKLGKENLNKDKDLKKILEKNFNLVYINQDVDFIPVDLISTGTPAYWFTDKYGKPILAPIYGARNMEELSFYSKLISDNNE